MFYCDKCGQERNWPTGLSYSFGPCEVCEKSRPCNDIPILCLPAKPSPPMTAPTDRPAATADPMPEPTPDRGVGELSDDEIAAMPNDELIQVLIGSNELSLEQEEPLISELLRRLAATERPADGGVTISKEDIEQALDAMAYVKERLDYFWDKWNYQPTYDRMKAALSAERDGATT